MSRIQLLLLLSLAMTATTVGCRRGYYREQADHEVYGLILEKNNHPHWVMDRHWIDVDPRSRMFDPFDPDHPPMPEDDPASHQLMHLVDGRPGYPGWHDNGDACDAENPYWRESLDLDENGVLVLTGSDAYRLALLHSTNYQQELETLYLSALDVTTERFQFDGQLFAGNNTDFTSRGRFRTGNRSEFSTATNAFLNKGFITGANLVVGFANTLVWDFSSTDTHTPTTLIDLTLIQPLLQNGGRERILERLTLAERTLLSNVRQMERFRRGFFVEIMMGQNAPQGPSRRGGVFGTGLEGFTGLGGGGFGGLGGFGGGGGGVGFGGGGAGAAQVGGYVGLLQDQQAIRNQRVTIAGLRSNLVQLRESLRESLMLIPDDPESIVVERLQIAQARQALLNAEGALLNAQAQYSASLDNFKRDLGLPPTVCIHIEDPLLDQFDLIRPEILSVQDAVTSLRAEVGNVNEQILDSAQLADGNGIPTSTIAWTDDLARRLRRLREGVERFRQIRDRVRDQHLAEVDGDIAKLRDVLPRRRVALLKLRERYDQDLQRFNRYGNLDPCQMELLADIDPSVFDLDRLDGLLDELTAESDRLRDEFGSYEQRLDDVANVIESLLEGDQPSPEELYKVLEERVLFAVPSLLATLSADILDLSLVQARARTHSVEVTPVEIDWQMAVELASRYRRDWMNRRAGLVDTWRLIEFNADRLESGLDIVFDGEIQNVGDNPVRLRDVNGQLHAGIRFDAPITRLTERNTYREALIQYQQARRGYYRFVDGVTQSLRGTLRTIDVNRINFEERRIAVISAIEQVVLNDQLQKLREERGQAAGVTAARDVVSALDDLQQAQANFLNVWVSYELQRMNLDLGLGTMNLDPDGNWVDPGPIGPEHGFPTPVGFEGDSFEFVHDVEELPAELDAGESREEDELLPPTPPGPDEARLRPTPHGPVTQVAPDGRRFLPAVFEASPIKLSERQEAAAY